MMSDYTQEFKDQVASKVSHLQVMVDKQKALDKQDYASQIETWNDYQDALTEIKEAIRALPGFSLARNNTSNLRLLQITGADFSIHSTTAMGAVAAELYFMANYILTNIQMVEIPLITAAIIEAAYYGVKYLRRGKEQVLKVTTKPVLHVNELEFVHLLIKGTPKVAKDPDVPLPTMHIEIPRNYIARESLRYGMRELQHIKLTKV